MAASTIEYSQLKVRGDTTADRTLKFLKPSLTLDWKPSGAWHSQLSIRRTVAQLDFYDFISVAELSNDRVNGGNADLLPQRAWEFRATVDHPLLGDGLAKLELGYDHISLLQDRILTEEGFDAPGNIGTGRRSFARLTLDAPLAKLGLTGARLKLNGEMQRTRVDDPISGEPRNFSGLLPRLAVERRLSPGPRRLFLRLRRLRPRRIHLLPHQRIRHQWQRRALSRPPSSNIAREPRTTVTLDVDNAFDTGAERERLLFFPNRRDTDSSIREFRERNRHVSIRPDPQAQLRRRQQQRGGAGRFAQLKAAQPIIAGDSSWPSLPSCPSTGPIRSTSTTSSATKSGWFATPPRPTPRNGSSRA